MARILLLIILIWVLYTVVKRFLMATSAKKDNNHHRDEAEKIVACSQCGVHIPENEMQRIDDLVVCNNPNCMKKKP